MKLQVVTEKATAQQVRAKDELARREIWAYRLHVSAIRGLQDALNDRALCVVDRAETDDPSHAEIWGAKAGVGQGTLRAVRNSLLALMSKGFRVDVEGR